VAFLFLTVMAVIEQNSALYSVYSGGELVIA
jgi:hypothetical protein